MAVLQAFVYDMFATWLCMCTYHLNRNLLWRRRAVRFCERAHVDSVSTS